MDKEGTLVDYYTRRLTNNYRVQFSVLADAYSEQIEKETQKIQILNQISGQDLPEGQIIKTPAGEFDPANVVVDLAQAQMVIDSNTIKATDVLDRSFIVMPEFNVPYGRVIPSYISTYYAIGNEEKAEFYTNQLLELYQSEIDYYLDIDAEFTALMISDMFDAYRGVFSLYQASQVYSSKQEFKDKIADQFFSISTKIQTGLNPIRKVNRSAGKKIEETFDIFFQQINA